MNIKIKNSSAGLRVEHFSKAQPLWQFILLCVISFGIYEMFWSYKNWKLIKEHYDLKILPLARSLFFVIFAYSLFKNILKIAKEKGYKANYMPSILAVAYIGISFMFRLPFPYLYFSLLAFVPLIPVQQALNYYWLAEQPDKAVRNQFTRGELIFIIIFGLLFLLNAKALLFP